MGCVMKRTCWLTAVVLSLGVSLAQAQEPAGAEEDAEPKNAIGVYVGALSNLETNETGPGVGFDYAREVGEKFGVVGIAEWANAGEREAMFAGGLEWKPGGNIKLVFAPGVVLTKVEEEDSDEDSSDDDGDSESFSREALFAFRTGIGYMFEVSHVPLTPMIYFDIVQSDDGVDAHLVYGLTIDIPF